MMKNLLLLITFFTLQFLIIEETAAQGANCNSSDPFCTGTTYTFPNTTNNGDLGAIDCLGTSPNPAWYYMEIDQNGPMTIQINQTSGGSGIDVDFALFGPYTSLAAACAVIPGGNVVDCSYSTAASETATIPNAQIGEIYVLLLTNFSNQPGTITFNQSGGSGSADCSLLCGVTGFTANPTACNPATNTYNVSGTLSINNPPGSGTCTITSSCGGSQVFNAPFGANLNYSFTNITANGAGCTVTATFSADATCNTSVNYTAPAACLSSCFMTNINVNISACDPATNTYTVTGTLDFTSPPAAGQLIISTCGGNQQVINPPFVSPVAINIPNVPADGTTNCNVTATFTADPACTISVGPYTEPICPCNMDNMFVNIGACEPSTNSFTVTVDLDFTSPPSTGSLQVTVCGVTQNLPMPATSPQTFTFTGLPADGSACTADAFFTADPTCGNSLPFTSPNGCLCDTDAGTFTDAMIGSGQTNYLLCFNDVLDITGNGDFEPLDDYTVGWNPLPAPTYDPGLWLFIYSCPPTVGPPGDINSDPCLLGVFDVTNGDWSILNNIGDGSTYYFVPITMYSMVDAVYAISLNGGDFCYDLGPTYPVTFLPDITATGVENCAAGSATITVQGGNPAVNGGNFTASNLSPASASFSNTTAANGGTITITGLQNGDMYSFDIVDANGCPYTFSDGPFVGPVATSITPAGPFCLTDPSVNLVPSVAGGTFSGTGITNAAAGTFDPATAGIGTWTITYTPTGCYLPSTIDITVADAFDATIAPAGPFCQSNASSFLAAVDPGGTWSATCGACINATTGEFFPSLATVGNNTITYTIPGGCGDTQNTVIQVIADADATINPAGPFCITDPALNLTAAQTGGTWSGTGITSAANGTFNPATAGAGTHIITYNISGVCGDQDTVSIVVVALLPTTITPVGPFCENDAAVNLVGASPGGTWSGTGITNTTTGTFNPSVAGPGTWTITYSITGSCGTTSTLDITVNPLPVVTFTGDSLSGCVPVTTNFVNTTALASSNCTWFINGVAASNDCAGFSNTFNIPGCYDITLQTTSTAGCSSTASQTDMVCAYAYPVADFSFGPTDATVLNSTVNFNNSSTGASTYLWDFAGLGSSTATNPSFTFPNDAANTYQVCLEATSVNGCMDSTCQYVLIYDEFLVYVPNTFTPDADGINDVFNVVISGHDPLAYELLIFNRWGELIFESHSNLIGWDGYHNGIMAKQDVYVWKLKAKQQNNGEKRQYYGHVTLIK